MLDRTILHSINRNMEELADVNRELSTGRRINTVSDDVNGAARLQELTRQKGLMETYRRNIDSVKGSLSTASTNLKATVEDMSRALQLANQAATDTYSDAERRNMAGEVNGILEDVLRRSHAQYRGEYVFSGRQHDSAPFSVERDRAGDITEVKYTGSNEATSASVGPQRGAKVNMVGRDYFQRGTDVFGTLIDLREAMKSGDNERIRALVDDVEDAHQSLSDARAELGMRLDDMKMLDKSLADLATTAQEQISDLADTDMADASIRFNRRMSSLQTVLKVASKAVPPSLVNIL